MKNEIIKNLSHRKAKIEDLPIIIQLLIEDELGKIRESLSLNHQNSYLNAFDQITKDPNHYLMVVEKDNEIIGTCHLTLLPSLTFLGSTRMQIEAVRIKKHYRGQKIGSWMMQKALVYAKENNASIVQLTTNKQRTKSIKFYEGLGFQITHEGMKLYL